MFAFSQIAKNEVKNTKQLLALFSTSPNLNQQKTERQDKSISEWKKNVVIMPVQTTPEDLKRNHKLTEEGFYVSHRIYVEKMPEKYTIEPFKTRRTGGYDIETGILQIFR